MRSSRRLSFLRRLIILSVFVSLVLAATARPVVKAVVLPPNENRDGEIMLSLDSNAYTDAMRIYLRYPTQIYYGTEYVTLELVMSGIVGNVAYAIPAVQYLEINSLRYGSDSISDFDDWLTADVIWDEPIPSSLGYYSYSSSIFFNVPIGSDFTAGSVELDIMAIVVPYSLMSFDGYVVEAWWLGDGPISVNWDTSITIDGVDVISDYDRGYIDGKAAAWDELQDIVYSDGYQNGYDVGKKDGIKIGTSDNPIYKYYDDVVLSNGVRDEIINVDGINQLHDNVNYIIAAEHIVEIGFDDDDDDGEIIAAVFLLMPNDYKNGTYPATKKYYIEYYWHPQQTIIYLPQFDTTEKVIAELEETIVWYELADNYKSVYYMTDYDDAKAVGYKNGYDDGVSDTSAVVKAGAFDWVGSLLSNTAGKFLGIELWPGVTIGLLVGIPFAITLVAFVVGLLQGRKND